MPGLQEPTLGQTQSFDTQSGEFVQILHSSGCHWVAVARLGSQEQEIEVYDSLYTSLPMRVKECLAGIVYSYKPSLTLKYMNVQRQRNLDDCGIHAIATVTALCHGVDPTQVTFDPKKLRSHFIECLTRKKMSMFPIHKNHGRKVKRCKKTEEVDIYCTCCKPFAGKNMASCDMCGEWFHQACEVIPNDVFLQKRSAWYCSKCYKRN